MSRIAQGARSSAPLRRRVHARVAGVAALAVVAASAAVGGPVPSPVEAETAPPAEVLGVLPRPANIRAGDRQSIVGFDPARHRMYSIYSDAGAVEHLAVYDTTPRLPTLSSVRSLAALEAANVPSPYQSSFDVATHSLYVIVSSQKTNGQFLTLGKLDVDSGAVQTWDLVTRIPGFAPTGMTYSAGDNRIYLVGMMTAGTLFSTGGPGGWRPVAPTTVVVALTPGDASVVWARELTPCDMVLNSFTLGSLIARGSAALGRPTLFVPCQSGGAPNVGGMFPYQMAGIVALEFDPAASMAGARDFDIRFHPISGLYFGGNSSKTGIAGFDPGTDRVFMQSLSRTTPAAWVFDGRAAAWVGSITAPDENDDKLGVNATTGHYYMGGWPGGADDPGGFLLIADGRATPPQNGVRLDQQYRPRDFIAAEVDGSRIFVPGDDKNRKPVVYVLDDLTQSAPPLEPPGYDAQTDDIPESGETFVFFGGDTGGFGARVTSVGGTDGATSWLGTTNQNSFNEAKDQVVRTHNASRAIVFARSPNAGVQPAGAAASAQASAVDPGTRHDFSSNTVDVNGDDDPEKPETRTDNVEVRWPHGTETCLDGGEGVANEPEETREGFAKVTCNLKGYESTAEATDTAAATSDSTVARSSYKSKVKRTVKDGVRTDTTSSASGIHVDVPGVGTLDIGRVAVTATTLAHGRRGTASAAWTRVVDDVSVRDLTGKPLFQDAGCTTVITHDGKKRTVDSRHTSCEAIAEAVRKALQVRVKLAFPTPSVVATPKGAFAGIRQTDEDYYNELTVSDQGKVLELDTPTRKAVPGVQLDVVNDQTERSRLVVQLAAVEASSIFTVNASIEDPPCDTGGCIPGGDSYPPPDVGDTDTVAADLGDGDIALGGLSEPLDGPRASESSRRGRPASGDPVAVGLVVARRGFGQGALMTSLMLLFAAAVGSVLRRRRLLASLVPR